MKKTARLLRPVPSALSVLLVACATAPVPAPQKPKVEPPAQPIDAPPPIVSVSSPEVGDDLWGRMRGSFAMQGCEADPAVLAWAHRYTRDPQQFEQQMDRVLPQLDYVQRAAAAHGVPGEFSLLPWVESDFRPVSSRHSHAAGMWQIVPRTAKAMGLKVDREYDGRLDTADATDAVMKMLSRYNDQFGDWRLADYAYNSGEFALRRLIAKHGQPPRQPVVPRLPVQRHTREHLTKLLALSCVIREPERFGVNLPRLSNERELTAMPLDNPASLAQIARQAGIAPDALHELNPGHHRITASLRRDERVLLPKRHLEQFSRAMRQQIDGNAGTQLVSLDNPPRLPVLDSEAQPPRQQTEENTPAIASAKRPHHRLRTHVVRHGESLWQIAHYYAIGVTELQRWNHLKNTRILPGQMLRVANAN